MKFSSKTTVFQDMVGKAVRGASCNKLIPLTSFMLIELKKNQLRLITTDASNYLYIIHDGVDGDDFSVVVYAEQFAKLISKITSENVSLELGDKVLTVTANGSYQIELPLDENGELIAYPDPVSVKGKASALIKLTTIKSILATNKASLAPTTDNPAYTGYYVADKVVTTDGDYMVCCLNTEVFKTPTLISSDMMNLLDIMSEDTISVYESGDILQFVTKDCIVYGHKMDCIEDYAIDTINDLIDEKFKCSCKLNKSAMLSLLDRIALFVGAYDDNLITLTFTKNGLDVSSKLSNGVETINYVDDKSKDKKFKEFTCNVDIMILMSQIKANSSDTLEVEFGNDKSIKLVNDNVIQIIALLDDSDEE